MKKEELEKCRMGIPASMIKVLSGCKGCDYSLYEEEDEFGHYSTGLFRWKGKDILVTRDDGLWHVSINATHPIGYYELKEVRYQFCPDRCEMAQIFPSRNEFVNIKENCFHLYELASEGDEPNGANEPNGQKENEE